MEATERQLQPGERVPGTEYVILRLEAEGGHGALYLVRHHFLEKKVQMLKMLRSFEPSTDLVERLKREAQMLAAMDHPHIVSVTSGGLTDEPQPRPYFVMERLKGRSLAQILAEAPEGVGVDAALKVAIELSDALDYVHVRHGVVHRDIKPDNIFLHVTPRNGSVTKILDFGVAHIMDLEKRYTKNNVFLGTPRYASPEQVMGERPTPQTDLYAVGLVLYELLLGHGPFDEAQTFAAVATAHVKLPPPALPTSRRFPEGLEPLLMSLLAKSPAERPRSAEWLATQLRQIKRIAELAEQMHSQDLNQTEVSPVQNALTGHRALLTEAGAPPDVASEPVLSDPTLPGAPLAMAETMRVVAPEPVPSAIDRAAPTRSLHVDLDAGIPAASGIPAGVIPGPRTDTEQLPDARAWLPPGDPNAPPDPGASSRQEAPVAPPATAVEAATSTHAAVEVPPTGETRKLRWAAVAGALAALAAVALGLGIYARQSSSRAPASDPDTPLTSAPAPSVPVASSAPATPTTPEVPPAPSSASTSAPLATPAPPAAVTRATTAPAATASPAPAAPPRPRAPSPKPPLRLPSSGL